jgi:hypothetical protein
MGFVMSKDVIGLRQQEDDLLLLLFSLNYIVHYDLYFHH